MKRYLCYQLVVVSEKYDLETRTNTLEMNTIIRNVGAVSEEEALGKFIKEMQSIKVERKVQEPTVFELNELLKID